MEPRDSGFRRAPGLPGERRGGEFDSYARLIDKKTQLGTRNLLSILTMTPFGPRGGDRESTRDIFAGQAHNDNILQGIGCCGCLMFLKSERTLCCGIYNSSRIIDYPLHSHRHLSQQD